MISILCKLSPSAIFIETIFKHTLTLPILISFFRVSVILKEIALAFLTGRLIRILFANFVEKKSAFSIIFSLKRIGRDQ